MECSSWQPNLRSCRREREACWKLNSMSQAEVARATSTSVQAAFGVPDPAARDTLDGDEPSVRIRIPTGPVTPSAVVERKLHKTSRHAPCRRWCRWCAAARTADEPHLSKQQPETDEAASRIEFDSAEFEREEDQTLSTSSLNAFDDGSESSTATLYSTKAFSEQLAFVEVLRHNVVMLHSDQEPVLEQLLKTVQSKRPIQTSVRHGPRISHQRQSKIESVNQVSTTLENLLREKPSNDNIPLAWPNRHAAWSFTKFPLKNDGENRTFACFWKGLHESVAIRRKSDERAHCRANRQSESEMEPWNLDWRDSND